VGFTTCRVRWIASSTRRWGAWAADGGARELVIRAELPGLKQEDVDITLQNGVLTISGEHKVDEEEDRGNYHVRERRYGSFRRSMTLPEGTDESKVHARFEDGVLEVRVEGAAIEQAPKRIEIEGSSA
jgi:HSP20 family protein